MTKKWTWIGLLVIILGSAFWFYWTSFSRCLERDVARDGMTEAQVKNLMGEPDEWKWLEAEETVSKPLLESLKLSGKKVWVWKYYCKDPFDFSYNKTYFEIVFDKHEGKVIETSVALLTVD